MKNIRKILSFLGYTLGVIMLVAICVLLFLGAIFRMEDCVAQKSTSYCVMTQKNFVFWDAVTPLKKNE